MKHWFSAAGRLRRLFYAALLLLVLSLWPARGLAAVEIAFYSREFGSTFPHAYVVMRGTVEGTGERVESDFGFTVASRIGPSVLFGPVRGTVISEGAERAAHGNRHFSLTLSDAEYRRVIAVVERWRRLPQPSYDLNRRNCVFFVAEIAAAIGLRAEPLRQLMRRPRAFLDAVHSGNAPLIAARGASPGVQFGR